MDKQYFIYITTNLVNGKKYIGKHYGTTSDSYLGSGTLLKKAIKKYGKRNFVRRIIDFSDTEQENCEKEIYYIALFNACENELFYNIHEGGGGGNTTKGYTDKQKRELSKKLSIMNSGIGNPMYGKHFSEETKRKMSYSALYKRDNSVYRTEKYRLNMSKLTSGKNNGMYGKHHSKESKQKMSINSIGKTTGCKNGMYGKSGDNAINGKKVNMYDLNHNFIKTFNCKKTALSFLNLKGHTKLNEAIKNNTPFKGYYWKQV